MIRIDVYHHGDDSQARKLDLILGLLNELKAQGVHMAANLDQILQDVTDESNLEDSILQLLQNLQTQIQAAGGDQTKIDAIFAALEANKTKLTAAVTANTPVDPNATPPAP